MNKRTKLILIIAAALIVVAVAVWLIFFNGNGKDAGNKMIIGTEGVWSPYTYHDPETDALTGFDIDVAKAVAEKIGMEAEFAQVDFDAVIAGVQSGRYTTGANFIDVTEERAKTFTFSDPYAYGSTVLIVRADNEDIHSFEDLNGRTTANSAGSTYMSYGEKFGAKVTGIPTLEETMVMVESGRVDATINASGAFTDYMQKMPDAQLKVVAQLPEKIPVAFPFKKDADPALGEKVNNAIAELRADGPLAAISVKYFGYDITQP